MRRFHSPSLSPAHSSHRIPPVSPIILVLLLLAAGVVLFFLFFSSPSRPFFSVDTIAQCIDINRSAYNLSPAIFSDLPPAPKCFSTIVDAYRSGQFSDTSFFSREYYLQPEFYPNFLTQGLFAWTLPPHTHYGATGYGSYPNYRIIQSTEISSPTTIPFFVFAGFGVRSLQRMTLDVRFENPSDADFFSVELDESSRAGFILGPTFPKFSSDWAHPVILTITSRAPAPSRTVSLLVRTIRTSSTLEDSRSEDLPFFDSVDYTGERDIFRVIIAPSP